MKKTVHKSAVQIDIYSTEGNKYEFLFITKGEDRQTRLFLYQQSKSLLNEESHY